MICPKESDTSVVANLPESTAEICEVGPLLTQLTRIHYDDLKRASGEDAPALDLELEIRLIGDSGLERALAEILTSVIK